MSREHDWQQRIERIKETPAWVILQRDHEEVVELLEDISRGRGRGPVAQMHEDRQERQDKMLAELEATHQADTPTDELPWSKPSGRPW